jgi:hypothetical protein
MEITKEQFKRYVGVQMSGVTNMFMLSNVMEISGLTKEQCLYIMKHYTELKEKHKVVEESKIIEFPDNEEEDEDEEEDMFDDED